MKSDDSKQCEDCDFVLSLGLRALRVVFNTMPNAVLVFNK